MEKEREMMKKIIKIRLKNKEIEEIGIQTKHEKETLEILKKHYNIDFKYNKIDDVYEEKEEEIMYLSLDNVEEEIQNITKNKEIKAQEKTFFTKIKDKIIAIKNKYFHNLWMKILLGLIVIFIIFIVGSIITKGDVYQYSATNYHTNLDVDSSNTIRLNSAIVSNKVNTKTINFSINDKVKATDTVTNKIYLIVKNQDGKKIYANFLDIGVNDVPLIFNDENYDNLESLKLEFYSISDVNELKYSTSEIYIELKKDDLATKEDINNFIKNKNMSDDKKELMVKYIRKIYLSPQQISDIFDGEEAKNIENIFNEKYNNQYEDLQKLYKEQKEKIDNKIQIMKDNGILDSEIKDAFNSDDPAEIKSNLNELGSLGEDRLTKNITGMKEQLNRIYAVDSEKINNLVKNKTPQQQKKILENEIKIQSELKKKRDEAQAKNKKKTSKKNHKKH